jgi:hypothetical protein
MESKYTVCGEIESSILWLDNGAARLYIIYLARYKEDEGC